MSGLANGKYRTAAGSVLEVSGEHSDTFKLEFHPYEEPHACDKCKAYPYAVEIKPGVFRLVWHCKVCDGGSALLMPVPKGES